MYTFTKRDREGTKCINANGLVRDSSAGRRLFVRLAGAVGRQSALHKENSGFAAPTPGRHISTFRGYQILFSIRNPYINRFTQSFFYSFITILPSESGATLDYCTIFPYGEHSDVPRLQQVKQKAVGRQRNLGLSMAMIGTIF